MAAPLGRVRPPELERLISAKTTASTDDAWAEFVETHSRLLLHVARSVGGGYDAAMDRYSFVLDKLREDDFKRLRAFTEDGRSKFTTWLVVVARRLIVDHHREKYGRFRNDDDRSRTEREIRRALVDLVAEGAEFDRIRVPRSENPERVLRKHELADALAASIDGLEGSERLMLSLRFEDGLTGRELARVLDLPTPFHAYRRIEAILKKLRARLEEGGFHGARP